MKYLLREKCNANLAYQAQTMARIRLHPLLQSCKDSRFCPIYKPGPQDFQFNQTSGHELLRPHDLIHPPTTKVNETAAQPVVLGTWHVARPFQTTGTSLKTHPLNQDNNKSRRKLARATQFLHRINRHSRETVKVTAPTKGVKARNPNTLARGQTGTPACGCTDAWTHRRAAGKQQHVSSHT